MDITYLGHSSFKIKTKTATIITDPYDPDMVGMKFPKTSADIVTISHDHGDHNKVDLVKDVKKVVDGPGEYEISQISIFGYRTYHDNKKGELRGKNTVYLIESEEMSILHLGDLGHKPDQAMIEKFGDVGILMIPVGGEYTIGVAEAVEVVSLIEPHIIIPMHYNHPDLKSNAFGKLSTKDEFLKEMSLPVETADKFSIKSIPEEQKIVSLEPING